MRFLSVAAACAALLAAAPASAVQLSPDGLGQALIYPYYTARSSAPGQFFQTLVTVVNHTADAKSVRVRFRDGANGGAVSEFNLFLGPRDMWTGAVIPASVGDTALLLSRDGSCVDPPIPAAGLTFAAGSLEGFIEVIEMATLTGAAVAAVTPGAQGVPPNCALVSAPAVPTVAAPSGGLSGTLTFIHVTNGYDFTLNAEALSALSTLPFHRPPTDPYPGFSATEITPVSVIATNGYLYRSLWPNGREAVSAVWIRSSAMAEYTVEAATQSRSDFVVTFPTRPYYPVTSGGTPPFWTTTSPPFGNYIGAGTRRRTGISSDGGGLGCYRDDFLGGTHCSPVFWARATTVLTGTTTNPHALAGTPGVFLSATPAADIPNVAQAGWATLIRLSVDAVTSLPGSTRLDLATGEVVTGAHTMRGMPQVGFSARTFRNGSLSCTSGTCQGNYGGVFPFRFLRDITGP